MGRPGGGTSKPPRRWPCEGRSKARVGLQGLCWDRRPEWGPADYWYVDTCRVIVSCDLFSRVSDSARTADVSEPCFGVATAHHSGKCTI